MNKLSQRLDGLIGQLNGEFEVSSSLSSHLSRASISATEGWSLLYPDLVEAGFPTDILIEQSEYVQRWLLNAFMAGRVDVESSQEEHEEEVEEATTNSSYDQQVRQASSVLDVAIEAQVVEAADDLPPARLPAPDLQNFKATRRKAVPPSESSTSSKKSSRHWVRSLTTNILKSVTLSSENSYQKALRRDLGKAVEKGDALAVKEILSTRQIDIGLSLLLNALEKNHIEVLSDLLCLGSFEDRPKALKSSIAYAMAYRNAEATVVLLENQAPFESEGLVRAMTFLPESAIRALFKRTDFSMDHDKYAHHFLYNAAKYGHESVFRSLVEQYGGINAPLKKTTAFHMACKSGNLKIIRLALELGGNVTITDENGYKPLHALVIGGEDENKIVGLNIQLLVKNGASIDDKLPNGQTALSLAAKCANIRAMEALMDMGLDPNTPDARGRSSLHVACRYGWVSHTVGKYVFKDAFQDGIIREERVPPVLSHPRSSPILFDHVLEKNLVDPRKEIHQDEKREEAVRLMLNYGASVNARADEMVTPLHLASSCARIGTMKTLLRNGADPHATDQFSWTSLHFAIASGSQEAIDLLIPYNIDRKTLARVWFRGDGLHMKLKNAEDLVELANQDPRGRRIHLERDPKAPRY